MTGIAPLRGVFALDWDMTETDNLPGLPPDWLRVGAVWRWTGQPVRLDGPPEVLPLGPARTTAEVQTRARAVADRLCGTVSPPPGPEPLWSVPPDGFSLTDGYHAYLGRIVRTACGICVVFEGQLPPYGQACWVTAVNNSHPAIAGRPRDGVICYASDTLIATPSGPVPIGQITPGTAVLTRDNGPQPVLWVGQTTLSGLALRRHTHLRPIRLRQGRPEAGQPEADLCVSPDHRVLLQGARARELFGADEVLARARDLVDYTRVIPDPALHGVTYVHLLLEAHQILFANGLPSESFHPALAPGATLRQHRHALRQISDALVSAPGSYGPTARRCLSSGEAALLAA